MVLIQTTFDSKYFHLMIPRGPNRHYRNNNSEETIYIPDDEKVEDVGYSDKLFSLITNKENKIQSNTVV